MATTERKPLKERLAAVREAKQSAHKEAKVRVASAWTLAKSLLPNAPQEIQFKMASALLANGTKALTAALRQTAINAHYTKIAEKFEQVHKVELNEFLEDESVLNKLKGEVASELKGEPKSANAKSAACKCGTEGCEGCETKTAGPEDEAPLPIEDAPPAEDAPADDMPAEDAPVGEDLPPVEEPPADDMPPAEEGLAAEIPDEVKEELGEKIDTLEADVQALEQAIEGEEELDFSQIFNEEDMGDKTDSLANEGDEFGGEEEGEINVEADGGASFFGSDPSDVPGESQEGVDSIESFFHHASRHDVTSMDVLLASEKTAATEAGEKIVERGEMADALLNESGVPDFEEDHDDVILYEVLNTIKPEKYDVGAKREGEPKLEAPKAAGRPAPDATAAKTAAMGKQRKAATLRSLGNVKPAASKEQGMLANLVFPDESEW